MFLKHFGIGGQEFDEAFAVSFVDIGLDIPFPDADGSRDIALQRQFKVADAQFQRQEQDISLIVGQFDFAAVYAGGSSGGCFCFQPEGNGGCSFAFKESPSSG